MAKTEALDPTRLWARCDAAQFDFETTASLPEPADVLDQARAVDAVRLALDIAGRGFDLSCSRAGQRAPRCRAPPGSRA